MISEEWSNDELPVALLGGQEMRGTPTEGKRPYLLIQKQNSVPFKATGTPKTTASIITAEVDVRCKGLWLAWVSG